MTTKHSLEKAQERIAERLVELGYAKGYISNDIERTGFLDWTDSGFTLRNAVRRIFDVPKVAPRDVNRDDAIALIGILIFDRD